MCIDGKTNAQDVLYVEGLKHNLLSVSKMCDKGYNFLFHASGCEIRNASSGRLVAEASRTSRIYTI